MINIETVAVAIGSSLLTGGALFKVLLAAAKTEFVARSKLYDDNDRPLFIPREEFNGMSQRRDEQVAEINHRIEQNSGQIISHTDRLADIDNELGIMKERNTRVWEAIAKDMSNTAETVKETTKRLEDLALRFERIDARAPNKKGPQ